MHRNPDRYEAVGSRLRYSASQAQHQLSRARSSQDCEAFGSSQRLEQPRHCHRGQQIQGAQEACALRLIPCETCNLEEPQSGSGRRCQVPRIQEGLQGVRSAWSVCLGRSQSIRSNQRESLVASHGVQVAFPSNLAPQLAYLSLAAESEKSLQTKLHNFTFRAQTSGTKRVSHELVINHDVGSHGAHESSRRYTLY